MLAHGGANSAITYQVTAPSPMFAVSDVPVVAPTSVGVVPPTEANTLYLTAPSDVQVNVTGELTVLPFVGATSVGGAVGQLLIVVNFMQGVETVGQLGVTDSTRHSYCVPC